MNSKKRLFRVLFPALLFSTLGFGQSFPSRPAPDVAAPAPEWGTSVESALVIGAFEFQGLDLGTTIGRATNVGDRYVSAGGNIAASFNLPKGALITGIELQGCNTSTTSPMDYYLYRMPTGGVDFIATGDVPLSSSCGKFRTNLSHVVDASTGPYLLIWQPSQLNASQLLTAMRVYYKLQISPDPSTATFTDVPVGSLYHRFVEALVAAGITGGCGGGNYCPDAPVTRGQIAVFLSAALGLHWAP